MKTYRFQSKYTLKEIIYQLKKCTKSRVEAVLEGGIGFSQFGNRIRLIKKKNMQNPFQRVFVGCLQETQEGTALSGRFCYPIFSVLVFVIFESTLLHRYINMLFSTLMLEEKCIVSLVFFVMFSLPVLLLITGITKFQNEEDEVIKLLSYIMTETNE